MQNNSGMIKSTPGMHKLLLVAGILLFLAAVGPIWKKINLSLSGTRTKGRVVDFVLGSKNGGGVTANVEIRLPRKDLQHIIIRDASSRHSWAKNLELNLICEDNWANRDPLKEYCEIDALWDRWFQPAILLTLSVVLIVRSKKRLRTK